MNFFKKYWPELLLLTLILFFLREILFFGKIFVSPDYGLGDYTRGQIPLSYYLSSALKEGRFPLWMPEIFAGFPVAANGEAGLFYPLNLLLFSQFPYTMALNLYALLTFLVMGFGTFYFLRSLKLSKEACLIASLSFIFASGMIVRIVHMVFLGSVALLPLSLLLVQKYFEKRNPLLLLLMSLLLSFQILNYNPPTTLVCFTGFFVYFLFRIITTDQVRNLVGNLFRLFLVFFLAFSSSAILLLPDWTLLSLSERKSGLSEETANQFPFNPEELAYFLRPTPFGDYSQGTYNAPRPEAGFSFVWENNAYIGLVGLVLGVLAIFTLWRTKKNVIFFSFLLIFSLFLALANFTSFSFIHRIPPFSFFRAPGRFLILSMFSLAVLSGFGAQYLLDKFPSKRTILGLLFSGAVLLDLFSFGLFYNPTYDAQKWLSPPQTVQFLKQDSSYFRIFTYGEIDNFFDVYQANGGWRKSFEPYFNLREGLPPDINLIYNLNHTDGWIGLAPKRSLNWQSLLYQNIKVTPQTKTIEPNSLALKMLRLKNVKYVITTSKLETQDFILKRKVDFENQAGFYLYEFKDPLPHAFLVHRAQEMKTEEFPRKLAQAQFDPQTELLLEEPFENVLSDGDFSSDEVEIVKYLPEKVVIRTKSDAPAFLVLTDTNFPGWVAKVDNQPVKIYQADYLFRAARINAGEHQIEFEYKPKELYLGAAISLVTLLVMFLFSLYWITKTIVFKVIPH